MADEQRREPRVTTELRIRLASGEGVALAERSTVDLSRGGVFVRTLEPQPQGTRLHLDLALAGGLGVVRAVGEVAWTTAPSAPGEPPRAPGMGIRFVDLDPASAALLDRYVAKLGGVAGSAEVPRPADAGTEESRLMQAGVARGVPPPEGGVLPAVELPNACREQDHKDHDRDPHHDDD